MLAAGASGHVLLAVFLNTGLSAFFLWAAAVEFVRGRDERLRGRSAMVFVLVMQGIATVLIATGWQSGLPWQGPRVDWSGLINFVGPLFSLGSAVALVTMLKDRSEIDHKRAAFADPLTGLPNRRAITAFVADLFEARTAGGGPISVLAFDLDWFKAINDTHGHATGDQTLRVFADVLRRVARKMDMASRMGGEEFALVLAGCDVEVALAVARRIRAAFQDDGRFVDGKIVNATVSIGVATCPEHGDSFEDLLARADEALYRAKSLGRNRVVLSSTNSAGPRFAVSRIA
jgi:diguanylate cyclase (GGDEF)-like protein